MIVPFLPPRKSPRQIPPRPVIRDSRTHTARIALALCCSISWCAASGADEKTNLFVWPKPFQRFNYGTPPLSPDRFNPDTGVRLEPNYVEEAVISYELVRRSNSIAPAPPPQFNPDPGA